MITSADIEAYYNITLTTEQKDRLDSYIIPALTSFTERYCKRSFGLGSDFNYKYEATVLPENDGWEITTVGDGDYDIVAGKLLHIVAGDTGQAYKRVDASIDFSDSFSFEIRAKFDIKKPFVVGMVASFSKKRSNLSDQLRIVATDTPILFAIALVDGIRPLPS